MNNVYFFILSGGSGTRLWPLSRKKKPKQLLPFLNNKSLLEQTIDRISPLATDKQKIGIITIQEQSELIPNAIQEKIGFILQEPAARNTGPAILFACMNLIKKNPKAIAIFLPADHFIPETEKFCGYLEHAIAVANNHETIVTLGLIPSFPATGYGYIQANYEGLIKAGTPYPIKKFHEKPTLNLAQKYIVQQDMFWNLGMFVGKAKTFINEYALHAPDVFSAMNNFMVTGENYCSAPNISIDCAIMEKTTQAMIIPCDFVWNDVGNLDVFLTLQNLDNNIISLNGKNNIAFSQSKKLIACVGIDACCIIETEDTILIVKRSEIEMVKNILPLVKEKKFEQLL